MDSVGDVVFDRLVVGLPVRVADGCFVGVVESDGDGVSVSDGMSQFACTTAAATSLTVRFPSGTPSAGEALFDADSDTCAVVALVIARIPMTAARRTDLEPRNSSGMGVRFGPGVANSPHCRLPLWHNTAPPPQHTGCVAPVRYGMHWS